MNPQRLSDDDDGVLSDGSIALDDVDTYKRYDCTRYDLCLSTAARSGWTQFHCNSCNAYAPLPADDPARRIFAGVGAALLRAERVERAEHIEPPRQTVVDDTEAAEAEAERARAGATTLRADELSPDTLRLGPVARLFSGRLREMIDDSGGESRMTEVAPLVLGRRTP